MGILIRGEPAVAAARAELQQALTDQSVSVRIVAAEAIARYSEGDEIKPALAELMQLADCSKSGIYAAIAALNALDRLPKQVAAREANALRGLPRCRAGKSERIGDYIPDLLDSILAGHNLNSL
jgi:uncharacterized sulfatase